MEKKSYFSDGISIDETKTSVLVVSLFMTLMFALVMYYKHGSLGDNLTQIVMALIIAIAGVNGVNLVGNLVNNSKG